MKKKVIILGVLLAMALLLAFSLAAPASAVVVPLEPAIGWWQSTNPDSGTAEYSHAQWHSADYSVYLKAVKAYSPGDYHEVYVANPTGVDSLADLNNVSFWYYCPSTSDEVAPLIDVWLDMDDNYSREYPPSGDDEWLLGMIDDVTTFDAWVEVTHDNIEWVRATGGTVYGMGSGGLTEALANLTDRPVLAIGIETGGPGTYISNRNGDQEFYIDDININGTTYTLEPRVINQTQNTGYLTIQSAIDAANDGDIINVAAGDYDEAVVIPAGSNLSLIGAGRDAVNWVAPPGTACISCDLSGYTGATTLEIAGFNFSFETTATEGGQGVGLKIYGASSGPLYLDVYDNTFIGTTDTVTVGNTDNSMWLCHNRYAARNGDAPVKIHDNIDQSTGGICMSNSQAFDIYENTFDGCSDALYIAHGCPTCTIGDHHIYENTFQNADNEIMGSPKDCPSIYFGYWGSPAGMIFLPNIIEENTFEGNDIAIGYYIDEDFSPPDIIRHNSFINNQIGVKVEGTYTPIINAVGNWWGDPTGPKHTATNPSASGNEVSDNVNYTPWLDAPYPDGNPRDHNVKNKTKDTTYNSIQDTINAADAGDIIELCGGTYEVDATIIVDESVTITGPEEGGAVVRGIADDTITVLEINANNVVIENIEFTHTALAPFDRDTWNELTFALVRIPNNAALSGVIVRDNVFYIPEQSGVMSTWSGIALTVGNSGSTDITITGNTVYNVRNGIVVRTNNAATVTNNTIFNTKGGIMNYTNNQADADNRVVTGNTWTSTVSGVISHNEWDIVWNTAYFVPDYQQSVLVLSSLNNDGYVVDRRAADAAACAAITGNRSHSFVDDDGNTSANAPTAGNINDRFTSIQLGVNAVVPGGQVIVAAGEYAGAIINKQVSVIGAAGGGSVITGGVPYKDGKALTTAFRLDSGADSTEIRNFTINNNKGADFYFAVFSRGNNNVIIDNLAINDTVQGITNWGGSGWTITNNVITDTVAAGGGGIGIFLGAMPTDYGTCADNLVQHNIINATATADDYSCPGICVCLDLRYGGYDLIDGTEDVSGNRILDNTITASGVNNGVGIEVGTILGNDETDPARTDPDKIAAIMAAAAVHDNTVQGNTVDGAEKGIYFYNVTGLSVNQNTIENSVGDGIFAEHGQSGSVIQNNTFSDNDIQLTDNTGTLDIGGILANNTFDRAVTVDRPGSSLLPAIWSNIQDAITAASPGDTVNVAPGLYSERIVIDKPLTLLGATHGVNKNGYNVPAGYAWDTSVESVINNPDPALTGTISVVLIKDTDDVTFDGFVVQSLNAPQGSQNDMLVTVLAETTTMNNITITNNVIGPNTNIDPLVQNGDAGRMGLYVSVHHFSGAEVFGLTDSSIANNKIFGCEGDGDNVFVWGTYASTSAPGPAPMTDTFIEDNEIYGSHRSGIETAGGISGLTIQGNDIYGNSGLSTDPDILKYGSGITLVRASSDRTPAGFGPVNVTIDGNIIHNNQKHGIYLDPNNKDIYITNNTFYENGYDAIVVDLIGNYFNLEFDLTEGPYTNLGGSENIVIYHNDIDSGAVYGVTVTGTPTNDFRLNATYNWWGVSDADAVAAKVRGAVEYDPWHLKQLEADTVADAKKTTSSVILTWTAEGTWPEDYYDFRYSTSPIDGDAAWAAAKKVVGEPAPVENKKQEMIVRNLNSGTTYYFALVITDGTNRSDISTIVVSTNTVVTPDTTPPADITGLTAAAGDPATTSVRLSWTATGDDGTTGFAARYIIKRSTSAINSTADFNAATTVFNSLTPKAYGEQETFTVTRLNPDTTYYFAVQAEDEAGNKSAVSTKSRKTDSNLPTVTGITADPAGTHNGEARTLTFTGVHFANAGAVKVRLVSGDNLLSLVSVNLINDTQLSAEVPKGVPTGTYQARVINNNGTSALSTATYTVTAAPVPVPVVTNVIPNLAASNTAVTGVEIFGQHFNGATAVTVNGRAADSFTVNSNTKITADIPGLSAGEYDVKVTTPAGTNGISAVKFIVSVPVNVTGNDTTTSGIIDLSGTGGNTQGQITLTTDNTGNSTQNTDADAEIEVVIPPGTEVTDNNGNPYTGTINPPRVIKPDPSVHTELPADALVIEMGNPAQTINFGQDFVTTVKVTGTTAPLIYYLNKDSGEYELAGKDGVKDGITYRVGGTVLNVENLADGLNLYTIGLLLDHMSVYVSSTESLLPGEPSTPSPGGGGVGGGGVPPSGTTNIRGKVSSTGRFLETVLATTMDQTCSLTIPFGTVGLDKDLKPLTSITMLTTDVTPSLPENWNVIGMAYDFGPSGAGFDPAITLKWKYNPEDLPAGANGNELKLAYYNAETGEWVILDSTVDVEKNTVTAKITHFTTFALIDIHKVATFTVGSLEISPSQVTPGETATVGLTVTNTGNKDGSYTVSLLINGVKESEKTVTVAAGASRVVSFDIVKETAGTYTIDLNGLTGSLKVTSIAAPEPVETPEPEPAPAPTSAPPETTPAQTQTVTPEPGANWTIIWAVIVAALVIAGALAILWLKRRRA